MSKTTGEAPTLREGDVYRWSWKPDAPQMTQRDPYWCRSQIGLVIRANGTLLLVDTYWTGSADVVPLEHVNLEPVANLNDLVVGSVAAHDEYEPADVVDLTHRNGGLVYVRKGAEPSVRVQVEAWTRKRDEALREAAYAQERIDALTAKRPAAAEAST